MRIYKFHFSYDKRVPHSLINILERHENYDVLSWENGKLMIASNEGLGKIMKIGQLISECTGCHVYVYHWPVNSFMIKQQEGKISDFEIEEKAYAIL